MQDLTIILPVFNERYTIETVLREWQKELQKLNIEYTVVISEDGSNDGTSEYLRKIQPIYKFVLEQKKYRRGYGQAVIAGIRKSKTPYVLCIDSDGQCDPGDLEAFWNNRGAATVLIGWRKDRADVVQRKLFSNLFKQVFIRLFPTNIHDPSAPFVLFGRLTIKPYLSYLGYLKEGFWWGFIGVCMKAGIPTHELPIHHRKRFNGKTQVYIASKIVSIALRNLYGLIRLKLATIPKVKHIESA
jgi:glycosyltransferase involved in cell wall biosynthesis